MKKLTTIIAFALAATALTGCVQAEKSTECVGAECQWNPEEPEVDQPELKGTYVSGHLGNYRDCSGEGYSVEGEDTAGAGKVDADSAGACLEGTDCTGPLNCEDAQMTINLSNAGEATARDLQIATIELFDSEGNSRAVLPLIGAVNTETNEAFDGTLDPGESVSLRVEFLGPEDPYQLLETSESDSSGDAAPGFRSGGYAGVIEMTVTAGNHDDLVIESTELYPVPSVDT